MIWVFAAVVLLLTVLYPRFGRFGPVLAGAIVVIIVILIVVNERNKPNIPPMAIDSKIMPSVSNKMLDHDEYEIQMQDKDDPEAKTRISIAEVRFGDIQPIFGTQSGTIQSIQARLYNNSKNFSLTNYSYYLVVRDCVPSKPAVASSSQCTIVYDQRKRGAPILVPPDQARDVSITVPMNPVTSLPQFKLLGKPQIDITATDTRAFRSPEHPQPAEAPANL
jgi:hypothetical protein